MPSATLSKTPKTTLPTSSRIERAGRLTGPLMTVAECDRILKKHGFRPATPEESRTAREAVARTDAKIARQVAAT